MERKRRVRVRDRDEGFDLSPRARAIGRMIDRLCRRPGEYRVAISVPAHRRAPWIVGFYRVEALQRMEIGRR